MINNKWVVGTTLVGGLYWAAIWGFSLWGLLFGVLVGGTIHTTSKPWYMLHHVPFALIGGFIFSCPMVLSLLGVFAACVAHAVIYSNQE